MVTYSQAIVKSNRIAKEIHTQREQLKSIYQGVVGVESSLANMSQEYGEFVSDVGEKEEGDPQWASMKGVVNKLVAEFQQLEQYAKTMKQAIEGVQDD